MSSPAYEFLRQLPTILPGESKQPIHNKKKANNSKAIIQKIHSDHHSYNTAKH